MPLSSNLGAVFPLAEIEARREASGELYVEFFRIPSMSAGIYALGVGAKDPQSPHREDEIYYVLRGRAAINIGGREYPVEPGATIFVAKGVEHRFHEITEALEVLVLFAPAESAEPSTSPKSPSAGRSRPPVPGKV
jgi:mannose-6-phosphate isomerase-like protein (cupin superfamily)